MANGHDEEANSSITGTADGVETDDGESTSEDDDGESTPKDNVTTAHDMRAVATSRPCLYARQWDRGGLYERPVAPNGLSKEVQQVDIGLRRNSALHPGK